MRMLAFLLAVVSVACGSSGEEPCTAARVCPGAPSTTDDAGVFVCMPCSFLSVKVDPDALPKAHQTCEDVISFYRGFEKNCGLNLCPGCV